MVGQRGQVHVVGVGETLWTLAEFYLGDPHLWPEIYRLNTLVVEDPHWIFPGEELRLAAPEPMDTVPTTDSLLVQPTEGPDVEAQAVEAPPPPPPPPPPSMGPTVLAQATARASAALEVVRMPPPRPTGHLKHYSAGFLTEGEELPWAELLGAADQSTLSTLRATSSATVFEWVRILAPENATYQVGDSLLVARLSRVVADWGRVVVPTGIVRVGGVEGRNVRGEVLMQFERIADGQVALPLPAFRDREATPAPIENGMRGSIIAPRDLHPVASLRDVMFVDRGRVDGIVPGDIFEVLSGEDGLTQRRVAVLEIVHVRERSASGLISELFDIGVRAGASVRLIRKMP